MSPFKAECNVSKSATRASQTRRNTWVLWLYQCKTILPKRCTSKIGRSAPFLITVVNLHNWTGIPIAYACPDCHDLHSMSKWFHLKHANILQPISVHAMMFLMYIPTLTCCHAHLCGRGSTGTGMSRLPWRSFDVKMFPFEHANILQPVSFHAIMFLMHIPPLTCCHAFIPCLQMTLRENRRRKGGNDFSPKARSRYFVYLRTSALALAAKRPHEVEPLEQCCRARIASVCHT